ncbi:MAG: hypothetical protein ROW39_00875 [Anaerolineaceae bacterium]|jgi:hypothetical protein
MKTFKNLYPQITAFENLYLAFKRAARGKRSKPAVAEFEVNLEENLFVLQRSSFPAEKSQIPGHSLPSGRSFD